MSLLPEILMTHLKKINLEKQSSLNMLSYMQNKDFSALNLTVKYNNANNAMHLLTIWEWIANNISLKL